MNSEESSEKEDSETDFVEFQFKELVTKVLTEAEARLIKESRIQNLANIDSEKDTIEEKHVFKALETLYH